MTSQTRNPRVLIVTPEISCLPAAMGKMAGSISITTGKLSDIFATLIDALLLQGVDVHIVLPDYRTLFHDQAAGNIKNRCFSFKKNAHVANIHLAEDRAFFYVKRPFGDNDRESTKIALAFQREVMYNILPLVQPDFIHCSGAMTGLIPAMAREKRISCLFTITDRPTCKATLCEIEDRGIDGAAYWKHYYFEHFPGSYTETRSTNPVDFLASGIHAAHFTDICDTRHYERSSNPFDGVSVASQPIPSCKQPGGWSCGPPPLRALFYGRHPVDGQPIQRAVEPDSIYDPDMAIARKYISVYGRIFRRQVPISTVSRGKLLGSYISREGICTMEQRTGEKSMAGKSKTMSTGSNQKSKRQYIKNGMVCKVTFRLPKEAVNHAKRVCLVGDFNNWDVTAHPMKKLKNGAFSIRLNLISDNEYQYRYLIDDKYWQNDWYADKYVRSFYGDSDNSVIIV